MSESHSMHPAINFATAFDYSKEAIIRKADGQNESSALDALADPDAVKELRQRMLDEDHLRIDGDERLVGLGNLGMVVRPSIQEADGKTREIPGAIGRIEYIPAVHNEIVLRPAFEKEYPEMSYTGDRYRFMIVPEAPDLPDKKVKLDDILRTLRVLKATHADQKLWDIRDNAFAFLKDEKGKLISYPDTANIPEDFRGKPIAFLRDLNALSDRFDKRDENSALLPKQDPHINVVSFLSSRLNKPNYDLAEYAKLPPAPKECVEAATQQYAVTTKLAKTLHEYGLEPNVPIPQPLAHAQTQAKGTEVGDVKEVRRGG